MADTSVAEQSGEDLMQALQQVVGSAGYRTGDDIDPRNYKDWMGARCTPPVR